MRGKGVKPGRRLGAGNEKVSKRRLLRKQLLAVERTQGKAAKVG